MPGWTMINGVWREMWGSSSNIDGVIRDDNIYCNINNVVRVIHERSLDSSSIVGLKLVYKRSSTLKHTDLPHLSDNPNLPVKVNLTGDSIGKMDTSEKGILFQYGAKNIEAEGVAVYEGYLFGILSNGEIIDITRSKPDVGSDERFDTGIPGYNDVWVTNRISGINIRLEAQVWYESFGLYTFGWNNFFSTECFLNDHNYPNKGPSSDYKRFEKYQILPQDYTCDTFSPVAKIGIARDMHGDFNHMIGSHGAISQTLQVVVIDGKEKPFSVEIYD